MGPWFSSSFSASSCSSCRRWAATSRAQQFHSADPLKTPEHIAPVWYFTPYYSILRAIPPLFNSQFPGVLAMGVAVLILFFLPWLDRSPVKSIRYRGPVYKIWLAVRRRVRASRLSRHRADDRLGSIPGLAAPRHARYRDLGGAGVHDRRFLFFFLMPWYTARDSVRPVPERVTV